MAFSVIYNGEADSRAFKDIYSGTLMEMFARNPNICAGEADIGNGMWKPNYQFMKTTYKDRFFDVGIQEADLVGIAAGLSVTGKVPYVHTFAPFMTRRTYDVIFISGAYAKLNIRMIGSDPGISAGYNGGTHMTFEDVGIMRNIPEMTIVDVTDCAMLRDLLLQTETAYGMFYFRFARGDCPVKIYSEDSKFEFGKANILRDGKDVTIIAAGSVMVPEALVAAQKLEAQGISARVVDIFTIKPIDADCIMKCAAETGAIVTAENHSVINGLGSAVAEVLINNTPCPLAMVGIKDEFGEVGSTPDLAVRFGLTADAIVKNAINIIKKKKGE